MSSDTQVAVSAKDKLKKAVKEYGSTVIVFHVAISLISLGGCYVLVSRYVILMLNLFLLQLLLLWSLLPYVISDRNNVKNCLFNTI